MTQDQLVAFEAVATLGTFSAAAKRLHKSQPAITKLVQNLEGELGLALFDRSGYRVALTDAGRAFLERAARVVADTEALEAYGRALARGGEAVVRIVLEAITPLAPVLGVLSRVRRDFPRVRFELRTERLGGAIEALVDGSADLVVSNPRGVDPRRMESAHLTHVRIVPVVHRDHPLARAGAPVPAAALREHVQVVLSDSARGEHAQQTINVLDGGTRWSVTEVGAKLQIIEAGMGWGGLPEHLVVDALRRGDLVALTIQEFETESLELLTIRRRGRAPGPVAQALWAALRSDSSAAGGREPRSASAARTGERAGAT